MQQGGSRYHSCRGIGSRSIGPDRTANSAQVAGRKRRAVVKLALNATSPAAKKGAAAVDTPKTRPVAEDGETLAERKTRLAKDVGDLMEYL